MDALPTSSAAGYSPSISAELTLHGERFKVAALGPDGVVLRSARPCDPGTGVIRVDVDGRVTLYHFDFTHGIDPARREQPVTLLRTIEEAAA